MKRRMGGAIRLTVVGIILTSIILSGIITESDATTMYNETDYAVNAYTYAFFAVDLQSGEGMGGWFRITVGDGIYFFIVNQEGHDEIQESGTASNPQLESDYISDDGRWYYWNFITPTTDTWYVYFSKAWGTTFAGIDGTLDIIIRKDTEPPVVHAQNLPNSVSGDIVIEYQAVDDCFPVEKVEFYVDFELIETDYNPNTDSGYIFDGQFTWHTTNWENGNYTISFRAYDTLNHASVHYVLGTTEVLNGDLGLFVLVGMTVIVISFSWVILQRIRFKSR